MTSWLTVQKWGQVGEDQEPRVLGPWFLASEYPTPPLPGEAVLNYLVQLSTGPDTYVTFPWLGEEDRMGLIECCRSLTVTYPGPEQLRVGGFHKEWVT